MAIALTRDRLYRPPTISNKLVSVLVAGFCLFAAVAIVISAPSGQTKDTQSETLTVEKPPEIEMVDVLIPVRSLDTGAEFMPDMFRVEQRQKIGLPSGTVTSFQQIQGQFAKGPVNAEQPMNYDVVTRVMPISANSATIPEGFRVITIPVDAKTSEEGSAKAGARVDIAWTGARNGRPTIGPIVYNAKVLSAEGNANSHSNAGPGAPSMVTLLLEDEDSAKIQLAMTAGSLSLKLHEIQESEDRCLTVKFHIWPSERKNYNVAAIPGVTNFF